MNKMAFSLVELSIVLVILGLLTGGILSGQSLIRAAELRAITTEYNQFSTAIYTFRDKYQSLPGDFPEGTRFWLKDSTATTCVSNSSAATSASGTCDGNGNGIIECGPNTNNTGTESYGVWKQLQLAGLLEGSFTGRTSAADCNSAIVGTNVPRSKLNNAGWGHSNNVSGAVAYTNRNFTMPGGLPSNLLVFGGLLTGAPPAAGILKPEEAWNIDTKIDDGKPARGFLIIRSGTIFGGATACTTAVDTNDISADYALNVSSTDCGLIFLKAF